MDNDRHAAPTPLCADVRIGPPPEAVAHLTEVQTCAIIRLEWNRAHTVQAYLHAVEPPFATLYGFAPGTHLGKYILRAAGEPVLTDQAFYGCVLAFSRDPWNHPLFTGMPR